MEFIHENWSNEFYYVLQHNTTQHNTTQHNTTQHNTTQRNATKYNTIQYISGAPRRTACYINKRFRGLRVSAIKLRPQLTVHNTSISLLLSRNAWVLLSSPIDCRETIDQRLNVPVPYLLWRKTVAQSSNLDQAGYWTRHLLVDSQRPY